MGQRGTWVALACVLACESPVSGDCLDGTIKVEGACRQVCQGPQDCLLSEICEAEGVCLPSDPNNGPYFALFQPTPTELFSPGMIEIDYAVFHAETLEIQRTPVGIVGMTEVVQLDAEAGTQSFWVPETSRFSLIAYADGQRLIGPEFELKVERADLFDVQLNVDRTFVQPGESVRLAWSTVGATGASLTTSDGIELSRDLRGSLSHSPAESTTYVLSAFREDGEGKIAEVSVMVMDEFPPPELQVQKLETDGVADLTVVVRWTTLFADRVKLESSGQVFLDSNRLEDLEDGIYILPVRPGPRTFKVTASGPGGTTQVEEQVVGRPRLPAPRFNSFSATPHILGENEQTELRANWMLDFNQASVLVIDELTGLLTTPPIGGFTQQVPSDETRSFYIEASTGAGPPYEGGGIDDRRHTLYRVVNELEPDAGPGALAQPMEGNAIVGRLAPTDFAGDEYLVEVNEGGDLDVRLFSEFCPPGLELRVFDPTNVLVASVASVAGVCPNTFLRGVQSGPGGQSEQRPGGSYAIQIAWGGGMQVEPLGYVLMADPQYPKCGDGLISPFFESCDDGNRVHGDGCDGWCVAEFDFSYTSFPGGELFTDPSATEVVWQGYPNQQPSGDSALAFVELPFDFWFYGRPYRGLIVHRDGFISFAADFVSDGFNPLMVPGSEAPNAMISVFRGNLAGGTARYWEGPSGAFYVDFDSMNAGPDINLSATIALHPDGLIEVHYRNILAGGSGGMGRTFYAGLEGPFGQYSAPAPCMLASEDGLCSAQELQSIGAVVYFQGTAGDGN